ncbi:hypothetical protein OQX63_21870 [Pedobacter sp. PF22-3]|nr:hypothetical protein [Pedobacter sp. PF22-3]
MDNARRIVAEDQKDDGSWRFPVCGFRFSIFGWQFSVSIQAITLNLSQDEASNQFAVSSTKILFSLICHPEHNEGSFVMEDMRRRISSMIDY